MKRPRLLLGLFVLLAIVLRVGAIFYTHATAAPAEENRIIARNLEAGKGFTFTEFGVTGPTAIRGPAYPFLLALIGPDHMGRVLAVNVLAGAGAVLAAYGLTKGLLSPLPCTQGRGLGRGSAEDLTISQTLAAPLPNPPPAYREREPDTAPVKPSPAPLIAAGLFAVWPTQVYAATLSQGLSIAVLLTLASLTLAFRRTPLAALFAGLLAGLAALTEPVLALPLLLTAIVIGWRTTDGEHRRRWHWPDAALFVVAGCVLVAPWLYRNAVIFGRPMPITSNFWRDAFLGNGDNASGWEHVRLGDVTDKDLKQTRLSLLEPKRFDQFKVSEPERILLYRRATLDWIKAQPLGYLKLCGKRLFDVASGSWFHPLAYAFVCFMPLMGGFAALILLPRYRGTLQSIVVLFAIGLVVPAVFVLMSARLIPFLDIATLLSLAVVTSR